MLHYHPIKWLFHESSKGFVCKLGANNNFRQILFTKQNEVLNPDLGDFPHMSTRPQLGEGIPASQARALVCGICQFDHGGKVHIESHQEPGVITDGCSNI